MHWGATLYNITTNNEPPSFSDILSEGTNAFDFRGQVSDSFATLVEWLMQPNRNERPQSVADIIGYLEKDEDETVTDQPCKRLMLNNHEAVELGLSVLWANSDIGTTDEKGYGDCVLWGDPNGSKTRCSQKSLFGKWFTGGPSSNNISGNYKYDTATNLWGRPWRMPTRHEFIELAQTCTWEKIDERHVKLTGPSGDYIILDSRGHWTSESPIYGMMWFEWNEYNGEIRYSMPTADLQHKDFVNYIFPIRPVADK